MSASVTWSGLDALKEALRTLPDDLTAEASHIVEATANATVREIKAGYKVRSGKLRDHVTQETVAAGQYGVGIRITNTSKLASLYEDGTQARHTAIGANRGAMPPAHVFRPPMIRNRRRMYDDLKAMLVNHGLTVTGDV